MEFKNLALKDIVSMFINATSQVVHSDNKGRVNLGVKGSKNHAEKDFDYVNVKVDGQDVIILITHNSQKEEN